MHSIDCQMTHDMKAETTALPATPTEADKVKAFMQQMIPHHANGTRSLTTLVAAVLR